MANLIFDMPPTSQDDPSAWAEMVSEPDYLHPRGRRMWVRKDWVHADFYLALSRSYGIAGLLIDG